MKIVIISGSTRAHSQSLKIAQVLRHKLIGQVDDVELLDLNMTKLPLYDDTNAPEWIPVKELLADADGYVWVVPEWNGTAGPGIMNLLAYIKTEMMHKPVLLAGVSSGAGGAYPLAQIKAFGAKNSHAVFVPEQLRFREVESIFNDNDPDEHIDADVSMHERADFALRILYAYTSKLYDLRQEIGDDIKRYPSGY